jgi:hypothetical protein
MRATESFKLSNVAPGVYSVKPDGNGDAYLFGGEYQLQGFGTGTGSVVLNQLSADGTTWEPVAPAITAYPILVNYRLPPGRYQIVVVTFTANYISLTRVPTSE